MFIIEHIKFVKDNDNEKIINEDACQLKFYDIKKNERLTGFYKLVKTVKFNDYQMSAIHVKQRQDTQNFPALERRNGDNYCTYCGKKIKTGDEHDTLCELLVNKTAAWINFGFKSNHPGNLEYCT